MQWTELAGLGAMVFFGGALTTLLLLRFVKPLGLRLGLVERVQPGSARPAGLVPVIGGIAIFWSLVTTWCVLWLFGATPLFAPRPYLVPMLAAGSALVHAVGLVDDRIGLSAGPKLVVQVAASLLAFAAGLRLDVLTVPGGVTIALPDGLAFLLTVLWFVGVTNAFNLIDGSDGLAGTTAIVGGTAMAFVALVVSRPASGLMLLALTGAVAGFLALNYPPAHVFLGDSGSLLVGFLLAALGLDAATTTGGGVVLALPVLAFGVPIGDTLLAILRRVRNREVITAGDRGHVHHRLLQLGHSPRRVVALSCVATLLSTAVGSFFFLDIIPLMLAGGLSLAGGIWMVLRYLAFPEFSRLPHSRPEGWDEPAIPWRSAVEGREL